MRAAIKQFTIKWYVIWKVCLTHKNQLEGPKCNTLPFHPKVSNSRNFDPTAGNESASHQQNHDSESNCFELHTVVDSNK